MTIPVNPTPPIHRVIENFTHKLDAIRETMDLMMVLAVAAVNTTGKLHLQALERYGKLVEENEEEKTFAIPLQHFRSLDKTKRRHSRAKTAVEVLPRTILVAFVSEFDAFLGALLRELLTLRPEVLSGTERQLSYRELMSFASIEDARNHLVSKEIEAFMRESYAGQFKWLENRFGVKTKEGFDRWAELIELTERRHLFVHTDGQVSTQYLAVCREHGVENLSTTIGSSLSADRDYLVSAYKCLYEAGVKLAHVLWRKLVPDQLEDADRLLTRVVYDLLVYDRFELATRLLQFHARLPRISTEIYRRMVVINLAQAYKWQKDEEECMKTLDSEDWSASSDSFRVCHAVLKADFAKAGTIMRRIGQTGEVTELDYRDWPVFREFRESSEFQAAFRDVFGKEPTEQEVHKTDAASNSPAASDTVTVQVLGQPQG